MTYIGEELFWGNLGNILIFTGFTAALISIIAYIASTIGTNNAQKNVWQTFGRWAFRLHSISVFGIAALLLYLLFNHRFEYHYVWEHSNTDMQMKFILSCLWEGQEGSFLLWIFWHAVLGNILILLAKEWEAHVMAVFATVQVFLLSMIVGIEVTPDLIIGSNPFTLTRLHPDFVNMPFTKLPDYLQKIEGRGLNPLLQNYWMVIHPPTLFLGFASTLVPFAYAIAGLWRQKFTEWLRPALPWAFFGVMILGTGILMGGAWAYEALSFGGFWAWDPVENSSLVPWITLVGAAHVMVIHKNKGQSLAAAFFLAILSFLLVLYSTFLTRSGILGDASVHAFTDLGMQGQLLIYMLFFVALSIVLAVLAYKKFPQSPQEDSITSREFWMFIGSLILFLSAFQIIVFTSLPVINKIFHTSYGNAKIETYNMWQVPFAFIISVIMAFGLYLKYKSSDVKQVFKKLLPSLAISFALTVVVVLALKFTEIPYILLLFSSIFMVLANTDYLIRILKGKIPKGGASIAHVGFGLILLGALVSTARKEIISKNQMNLDLGSQFPNNENILLYRNSPQPMGDYQIVYRGDSINGINIYHKVEYFKKNSKGEVVKEFTLFPKIQTNPRMGNAPEPDTRHFLHKDIYTHVTFDSKLQDRETEKKEGKKLIDDEGYKLAKDDTMKVGSRFFAAQKFVTLKAILPVNDAAEKAALGLNNADIAVKASLEIKDINNAITMAEPLFILKGSSIESPVTKLDSIGLKFRFLKIFPETESIVLSVAEKKTENDDFIIMQAIIFPGINILWLGCIIMVLGTVIAIINRVKASAALK